MIQQITLTSVTGRGSITMTYGDRRTYWLDDVDWGQVEGSHSTYNYLNQIGESIVSTTIRSRPIQITGFVVEYDNTLQDRCDHLNTYISPSEDYWIEYGDYKIKFRPDASITWSRTYPENSLKGRKFLIQGTAPFPLFQGSENTIQEFSSVYGLFHFPHDFGSSESFSYGMSTISSNITVQNTGGFETGIIAEISFSAELSNPIITNITTGKYLKVNYTFQSGDTLMISTMPGEKYMRLYRGEDEINVIKYRDVGMSWWTLQSGDNKLSLTCSDITELGGMAAQIYYTPLYQEVE